MCCAQGHDLASTHLLLQPARTMGDHGVTLCRNEVSLAVYKLLHNFRVKTTHLLMKAVKRRWSDVIKLVQTVPGQLGYPSFC